METNRNYSQNKGEATQEYYLNIINNMPPTICIEDDEPIDLTRHSFVNVNENVQQNLERYYDGSGHKLIAEIKEFIVPENNYHVDNPEYVQTVDKQDEVLKAAQSLFSKRTRTLYHWMYPNTPKSQLKIAVSLAWDTMGMQEKQFYISQVLGKFGFLQSSLMVNPQLGGMSLPSNSRQINENPDISVVETRNAVSSLLQSSSWMQGPSHSQQGTITTNKKRGRPRGSKRTNERYSIITKPHKSKMPKIHDEDEFKDDPELKKELEQFQWALHMVGK